MSQPEASAPLPPQNTTGKPEAHPTVSAPQLKETQVQSYEQTATPTQGFLEASNLDYTEQQEDISPLLKKTPTSPYYSLRQGKILKRSRRTTKPNKLEATAPPSTTAIKALYSLIETHNRQQIQRTDELTSTLQENIEAQNRQLAFHKELINVQLKSLLQENVKLQEELLSIKNTFPKSPRPSHSQHDSDSENFADTQEEITTLQRTLQQKQEEFTIYKTRFNSDTFDELVQINQQLRKDNKILQDSNKEKELAIQNLREKQDFRSFRSEEKTTGFTKSPKSTLVIRPNDASIPIQKLEQAISSLQRPEKVVVTKLRTSNQGIEIRCQNEEQKDALKTYLSSEESFKDKATIKEKEPRQAKIILTNIPNGIKTRTILENLANDHNISQKIITSLDRYITQSNDQKSNLLIQLPRTTARNLLQKKFIYCGFVPIRCKRYVRLLRCKICHSFNRHTTEQCKEKQICSYCAGPHLVDNCKTSYPKCHNCTSWNKAAKISHNFEDIIDYTDHPVYDNRCPVFLYERNQRESYL